MPTAFGEGVGNRRPVHRVGSGFPQGQGLDPGTELGDSEGLAFWEVGSSRGNMAEEKGIFAEWPYLQNLPHMSATCVAQRPYTHKSHRALVSRLAAAILRFFFFFNKWALHFHFATANSM